MKGFVLCVLVILAVMRAGCAIKCFVCGGTEEQCSKEKMQKYQDSVLMDCALMEFALLTYDRCIALSKQNGSYDGVTFSCGNELMCNETTAMCESLTGGKCDVTCCYGDGCNGPMSSYVSATSGYVSMFVMTYCAVFALTIQI